MSVHTPIESRPGLPRWAVGLTVFVLLVGGVYLASNVSGTNPPISGAPSAGASGGPNPAAALALIGKVSPSCTTCHGEDLAGQATFPSLHGLQNGPTVDNLKAFGADHPDDWMNLWIAGTDPAISDQAVRKGMPTFANQLSADQIDTIVTYILTLK